MTITLSDIPQSICKSIRSRSIKISRSFYTLEKEDLMQDGYLLVLRILSKKPDSSPSYLMTALKRLYSNKKKKAYLDIISRAELTDSIKESFPAPTVNIDHTIDKERKLSKAKERADYGESTEYAAMVLAGEYGLNTKEIKDLLGKVTNHLV